MTLEEYRQRDTSFDEVTFITKVNNIVIKFFNSITLNELKKVDHFVADKVYETGCRIAKEAEDKGNIHMFDEVNIRSSSINNITEDGEAYYMYVSMNLLYMDYIMNKDTGNVVMGDNNNRTSHPMTMVFKKYKHATEQNLVRTCPTCGASLNTNNTGVCEYCHSVYDQEDHDWVLVDIQGFNY